MEIIFGVVSISVMDPAVTSIVFLEVIYSSFSILFVLIFLLLCFDIALKYFCKAAKADKLEASSLLLKLDEVTYCVRYLYRQADFDSDYTNQIAVEDCNDPSDFLFLTNGISSNWDPAANQAVLLFKSNL